MKKLFYLFSLASYSLVFGCDDDLYVTPKTCYDITGKVVQIDNNDPIQWATIKVIEYVSDNEDGGLTIFSESHPEAALAIVTKSDGKFDISHCGSSGRVTISVKSPTVFEIDSTGKQQKIIKYSEYEVDGERYKSGFSFSKKFDADSPNYLMIKMIKNPDLGG